MPEARCVRCKDVLYQCHTCAATDIAIRRSVKKAFCVSQADDADSQKQTTKASTKGDEPESRCGVDKANAASMQVEARCDVCKDVMFPCVDCVRLQKGIEKSKKDAAKAAKISSANAESKAKQDLFHYMICKRFNIKNVPRDGHCLFNSFIAAQKLLKKEQLTVKEVRDSVAAHLIQKVEENGKVPEQPYDFFQKDDAGAYVLTGSFEHVRGEEALLKKKKTNRSQPTLQQYADRLRRDLYGGDLELYVLASLYEVTFHVYSWHFFDAKRGYSPQVIGSGPRVVSLLFEQDFCSSIGGRDHYCLMASQKFTKWNALMRAMPKWKVDIGPCNGRAGRGVMALRNFKQGDALLYYDGHRVDDKGQVVIERAAVKKVYDHFRDQMSKEYDGFFVQSHAVCLGRTHRTGLLIDGYPLTLSCFDDVDILGRGALANSASPKDSNMSMVWVEAPDLPIDVIDHLRDCEAILVARRDIWCVISLS
jgi:hypothetical protein